MLDFFANLDRRWVFMMMLLAVAIPVIAGTRFKEYPSPMVEGVFDALDKLPPGSRVLMALDFDPSSQGELAPMAAAFTRHAAEKGLRLYYMALWPTASPMIQDNEEILRTEYPDLVYGEDYVNLGYRPGAEGVIKQITTDLHGLYSTDVRGSSIGSIPMTASVRNIQSMDLIVNVSAGTPGTKEWVQYAASPFGIPAVAGVTGVGAPQLYAYIPNQLVGLLGGIKAAAEYEQLLLNKYPKMKEIPGAQEGLRRMGPQLVAHLLMVGLIIAGNVIYFAQRAKGQVR